MARRKMVTNDAWKRYKAIVNDFLEVDAGKQPVTWLKRFDQMLAYGEDTGNRYQPFFLDGLIQYNYIRTWPSLKETISGELDSINIVLYITKRSLEEAGHLTPDGYWDFDWVQDKFVINGKVYSPAGDTQVAQAHDEALLFFVVLKRETPEETKEILSYVANLDPYIELTHYILELGPDNLYEDETTVKTNRDFVVESPGEDDAEVVINGISVSPVRGKNNTTLSVVAVNKERGNRVVQSAAFTVHQEGSTLEKSFVVNHLPVPEFISTDIEIYEAEKDGGEITLTGKSNSPKLSVAVSTGSILTDNPDDITLLVGDITVGNNEEIPDDPGAEASYEFSIKLSASENPDYDNRIQEVVISTYKGEEIKITINQLPQIEEPIE